MPARGWWQRQTPLTKVLFALAVLASAVTVLLLGFVVYLFIGGYSGGHSPTNVAPVLFPIAFLLFFLAGLPAVMVSLGLWIGFGLSAARTRRRADPQPAEDQGRPDD